MNEDLIHRIDGENRKSRARVRAVIAQEGDAKALADFDQSMKDVETGVYSARCAWHSLSDAQKKLIAYLTTNPVRLVRTTNGSSYRGDEAGVDHGRLAELTTARALIARNLLECNGGAFDPEAVLVLTERGRFVFDKGMTQER